MSSLIKGIVLMTDFYTKIFVATWNVILALFTIGSIVALWLMLKNGDLEDSRKIMIVAFSWLGVAMLLGAMSIGISAYEKLCRLVDLKEKESGYSSAHSSHNSTENAKIEPTV